MKLNLTLLFVIVSMFASAQQNDLIDGKGFASCFSKMKEGRFNGVTNGILKVTSTTGDSLIVSLKSNKAVLSIIPDEPNEVYDVSYKKYEVESADKKVQILYQTYALANSLQIKLEGKAFQITGIDGGCDRVINGLEYEYVKDLQSEYLLLHFAKDVGLRVARSGPAPTLFIKKGSMLMFNISRK